MSEARLRTSAPAAASRAEGNRQARRDGPVAPAESDHRFRLLFADNPLPMWVYDVTTLEFLEVNHAAVAQYGYSRDEFLGMSITDIRPPEDVARAARSVAELQGPREQRAGRSGPWRHRMKDGRLVTVQIASQAIELDGRRARLVVVHDITAGPRAEQSARTLIEVGNELAGNPDVAKAIDRVVALVRSLFGVERVTLYRRDRETGRFHCLAGAGGGDPARWVRHTLEPGEGVIAAAVAAGVPVGTLDVLTDSRVALPAWLRTDVEETGLRSAAGVPLRVREEVVGAMAVSAPAGRLFTASDLGMLSALADQAALALENARLHEETQRRLQQTETLLAMSQTIGSTLDIAEVARRTTREIVRVLGADMGGAMILNAARDRLVPLAGYRLPKEVFATFASTPSVLEYPLVEEAKEVAGPIYASDSQTDPRFDHPLMRLLPHKSMLVVPMWRKNEIVGGFIIFWLQERHEFTSEELRLADGIARQAAIALENARLLADAEARRREAEVSRDFLESIAKASADAIITTDVQGRITYFSPGAEDMFGYRADEVQGRPVSELYEGGPTQADAIMERVRAEDRIRNHEMRFRAKDARWVDIDASVSLLRDSTGGVVGALGVAKDITDRKALESQLRQSQKMEAVGRLAGGVAHDFNNLLTVIMGRSELVMFRLRHDDRVRGDVALIHTTAEQAAGLTRRLLAFSRKQVVTPQLLDLNTVVGAMEQMLRRLIGEDVTLGIALEPALGLVRADPGQLDQVLMNLAVNARDAMSRGGRLTIETRNVVLDAAYTQQHLGVSPGPHVMLAVTDTGIGMDRETLSHIFEPFFTTKELGQGTGLGLALVYGTIQQCGGHIAVESEPNAGTTFRIYLPRENGAVDAPLRTDGAGALTRGSETILLVEDEEGVLKLASEILEMAGYTVLMARNGHEALRVAAGHTGSIELLLTDVVMPQMNGREVASRLASLRPQTRVLYMSGYTFDKIVHHGVAGSDIALLQKPFTLESLTAKVREALDGRPAR